MIIRIIGYLLAVVVLSACATAKEIYLPDGSKGFNISCDGTIQNMSDCYQKAGELCGAKGYLLINREGEMIPMGTSVGAANVNLAGGSAGYVSQHGMAVYRSLLVKCNGNGDGKP